MSVSYRKQIGELLLDVSKDGAKQHDYTFGCTIAKVEGKWNEWYPPNGLELSVEQLRDLKYLIDRALVVADKEKL